MERKAFESLVQRAIRDLPSEFREKLDNVIVIVEDQPSARIAGPHGDSTEDTLLGLYDGVPLTDRGFDAPLYPDRIWIFQKPIEEECSSDKEVLEEVKTTLIHEVAHFFGLDDDYLEELGY